LISVLLVDDQALIRKGFTLVLEAEPDLRVVGEAGNGFEAVKKVQELAPDVVLMDVQMPGLDGIEATRRITTASRSRVLILTTFDLDDYAFEGLRNGASGFLLKDVLPEALCGAIRAVADGDAVLTPRITREFVDRFAHTGPEAATRPTVPRELGALTQREREVLDLVSSGLSNAEVAGRLFLSEATVKTHVTRMLSKLGLRDRVQAVIYAYDHGLVQRQP
jgi:DNA-binding NarL/FixJ family response regulator